MPLLRLLTLITFLTVIIPDAHSGQAVITKILQLSNSPLLQQLLSICSSIAISYTLISLFLHQTQLTRKLHILAILIFYAFLLPFTPDFIQYTVEESLYPIILFLCLSILNLGITLYQLKSHSH